MLAAWARKYSDVCGDLLGLVTDGFSWRVVAGVLGFCVAALVVWTLGPVVAAILAAVWIAWVNGLCGY